MGLVDTETLAPRRPAGVLEDRSAQDRLVEALAEYHGACDAGQAPSREEFLARYADIAHELAGYLDGFDFIHQVAPQLRSDRSQAGGGTGSAAALSPRATLGDFQILRELGRGGMGVVYEAEQLSIGRRVALKVLPFAAMLDRQQLNRFRNEARAAGSLDHPNIVAIHSVGTERGVHYYAMQLIEGQSLAEVVAEVKGRSEAKGQGAGARSQDSGVREQETESVGQDTRPVAALSTLPEFDSREYWRAVARLGIQAAEALDHAHQNGVLHRDVKPANLLLDEAGKLWVTDFGLARIEQDAGMTMTGDLVGTLRYMSPEQALAKRVVVDHRSDIYSLGVTLYELITLRPAFGGEDRQELLRQIAFEEPRRLRQVNSRIPVDLETIVLKAMEKNPADRYATASETADDLRSFLQDLPIRAKPPTWWDELVKWSRRHPVAVWTTIFFLLTSTFITGIGAVLVSRAQQREAMQRQLAQSNERRANANAQRAKKVVDFLVQTLRRLDPELYGHEVTMVEVLRRSAADLQGKFDDDPLAKGDLFNALGGAFLSLGFPAEAIPLLHQAVDLRAKHIGPEHADTLRALNLLGFAYSSSGDVLKGLDIREETVKRAESSRGKDDPLTVWLRHDLALAYAEVGQYDQAEQRLEEVINSPNLAKAQHDSLAPYNLACVWVRTGRAHQAIPTLLSRIEGSEGGVGSESPKTFAAIASLAEAYQQIGKIAEAMELYGDLLPRMERALGIEHPDNNDARAGFAIASATAGNFQKATALLEEVCRVAPQMHRARSVYAWLLATSTREEVRDGARAVELATQACQLTGYQSAEALDVLAAAYAEQGQFDAAVKWSQEAVNLAGDGTPMKNKYMSHLKYFESNQPWRE